MYLLDFHLMLLVCISALPPMFETESEPPIVRFYAAMWNMISPRQFHFLYAN